MILIATTVDFEAAHRQLGDRNKCGKLHGHNWSVDFVIEGEIKDSLGYLINFSDLKAMLDDYDHKVILCREDPLIPILLNAGQLVAVVDENPTCENLAHIICNRVRRLTEEDGIRFIGITVWENEKSRATATWTDNL